MEKIVTSKLYEVGTNKRIFNIDKHLGMAVSGLISDARQIVEIARSEASSYKSQYGIGIPLKYLNERVSMYMHAYTLYSAVRPYGCSVILGAYEHDGPTMYMIDPSGVSYGYYGCAVGMYKYIGYVHFKYIHMIISINIRNVKKYFIDISIFYIIS